MNKREDHAAAGLAADALACGCVVVMYLAGHDIWNDTGRRDFWHLQGPPYFDIRVFVVAYYALALLTLGRLGSRMVGLARELLRLWRRPGARRRPTPPVPMNDFFDNWTVQMRKGLLELCILNALSEKERYGYELVKTLVDIPGLGVTEGTLYPLLSRLRVQGLISARLEESSAGPARKYYCLTREGRKIMATMNEYLDTLNRGTRTLQKGA
jgi:PadR family transcriptional regulator PadR